MFSRVFNLCFQKFRIKNFKSMYFSPKEYRLIYSRNIHSKNNKEEKVVFNDSSNKNNMNVKDHYKNYECIIEDAKFVDELKEEDEDENSKYIYYML